MPFLISPNLFTYPIFHATATVPAGVLQPRSPSTQNQQPLAAAKEQQKPHAAAISILGGHIRQQDGDVRSRPRDQAPVAAPIRSQASDTNNRPAAFDPMSVHSPIPQPLQLGVLQPAAQAHANYPGGRPQTQLVPNATAQGIRPKEPTRSLSPLPGAASGLGGLPSRPVSAAVVPPAIRAGSTMSPLRSKSPGPRLHMPSGAPLHMPKRLGESQSEVKRGL
jgi:hypothetical protein